MRGRRTAVPGVAMTMGAADDRLARFERQKIDWHGRRADARDEIGNQLEAVKARCAEVASRYDLRRELDDSTRRAQ